MSSVNVSEIGDKVCLLTLDMPDKSANVLTDQVFDDLDRALKTIEADPPRGIVLISAKPTIFVAGADLKKISDHLDWPDENIHEFCEHGRSIMARFSRLSDTVSVAAIHGVCVGGGLELPLWCDHRIVSDDRRTLLGFPEVKLGLIPGWAGTVRFPRLIGLETAVDLITSGDLVVAQECLELGLVTKVVSREKLIETSLQIIEEEQQSRNYWQRRTELAGPVTNLPDSIEQFHEYSRESIQANSDVDPSAPTVALNHMIDSADKGLAEACASETAAFANVWGSSENRGLLNYFFLNERAKKLRPVFANNTPPEITTIGIIGAGLMGTQIASLAANAGFNLKIYDAEEGKQQHLVDQLSENPRLVKVSVAAVTDLKELADCQLVVESIVEKSKIKQELLARLCAIIPRETFLATNTSTIPVHEIATAVSHPGRLVGLHFCCPVEPLRLVEVIRGEQTSDTTYNVAIDLVRRFRKTPVLVGDHPGFVVNRLLGPVFNEAIVMLQHNIDPERIDRVFREFGFAVGPLEMIDFIGVDTIMYAGETFLRSLPELISLTPVLPALVKRNRMGRKAGKGFYRYDSFDGPPLADDECSTIIQSFQQQALPLTDTQVLHRLLDPMVTEARKLLSRQVVSDSQDVDLCSILGATFPAVRGGVLFWAENLKPMEMEV